MRWSLAYLKTMAGECPLLEGALVGSRTMGAVGRGLERQMDSTPTSQGQWMPVLWLQLPKLWCRPTPCSPWGNR